jgi:hypothetical protein
MERFHENEMFCINCYLHDTFWSGGNSWGIDHCPNCGSYETILYKNMTWFQRIKAKKLFDEWWNKTRIRKKEL